jgi:hypothetical protein
MTEEEAFKQLASETLGGFGWSISVDDIPDYHSVSTVFARVIDWWNSLSQDTRDIIRECDFSLGLWNKGWLNEFPAFYNLLAGKPFGEFWHTTDNIRLALRNAHDRAPDYAAQHAIGRLADDPVLGQEAQ